MILEPGDIVVCIHTLRESHVGININGEKHASLFYWQIYGKVDGDRLIPTCNYNFLEPKTIEKEEEQINGIIRLRQKETTHRFATVLWPCQQLLSMGVKPRDEVMMQGTAKNGQEYEIEFNNKLLIMVRTKEIVAKIDRL
jgi:hypothetical protein